MTVTAFYPDKDTESTSVDGMGISADNNQTWATKRGEAGTTANDSGDLMHVRTECTYNAPEWRNWSRVIVLFDISSLAGATVSAVSLGLVSSGKDDDYTDGIAIVSSAPASNTAIVGGDYDSLGTTRYATDITIANINSDSATYNVWTLNSTGIAAVDGASGGIVKLGMRTTFDNDDNEPDPVAGHKSLLTIHSAEESQEGEKRPTLTVTSIVAFTPRAIMF